MFAPTPELLFIGHRRGKAVCSEDIYYWLQGQTSDLCHLVVDGAQTENVLGGEDGALVDECVVNACHIARSKHCLLYTSPSPRD